MPRLHFDHWLTFLVITFLLLVQGAWSVPAPVIAQQPVYELLKIYDVPVDRSVLSGADSLTLDQVLLSQLSAQAVFVLDADAATPLLEKNAAALRYPASTTKLLTALVAVNHYDLDREFVVKEEAFTQGTTMGLQLGERISVHNLLYGLLMNSGNDAAFTLANNYPGGYSAFITEMNQVAQELHLTQTTFTNPSGLDQVGHQSSAHDLALLAHQVMKHEVLREIVGTKTHIMTSPTGEAIRQLQSTNALLGVDPGVQGVKTGTTDLAGEVLITQIERNGHHVIIVVMGSLDRYSETRAIMTWLWQKYQWLPVQLDSTQEIKAPPVPKDS